MAQRLIMVRVERLQSKSHYIIDAEQVGDILRDLYKTFIVLNSIIINYSTEAQADGLILHTTVC